MCSSAPDTSGLNAAAKLDSQTGKDALEFYKKVYGDSAPDRANASALSARVANSQINAMDTETGLANEAADYQRSTFRPLETGLVKEAQNYDTEGKREQLAGLALGDVHSGFQGARDMAARELERHGENYSDGASKSLLARGYTDEALAGAQAANKARTEATTYAHALQMDAAGLGRGLPSQQATAAGLALSSGNSAVANGQVPLNVAAQGAGVMQQGFGTAINGFNSSGNLYGQIANIDQRANDANSSLFSGLGQAAGRVGAAYFAGSDKNTKKDVKAASPEISLRALKRTPISRWTYKPGEGDGGTHTGAMAQDVRKNFGEQAAPGGKVVDLISLAGHAMNAVKAVDKKVVALQNAKRPTRSAK